MDARKQGDQPPAAGRIEEHFSRPGDHIFQKAFPLRMAKALRSVMRTTKEDKARVPAVALDFMREGE